MYGVFLPLFNWLPSRSLFFHQFGLSGEFKKALSIDWLTGTDRLRLRKCARWLVICGNSIRTELVADEAVSHTPSEVEAFAVESGKSGIRWLGPT